MSQGGSLWSVCVVICHVYIVSETCHVTLPSGGVIGVAVVVLHGVGIVRLELVSVHVSNVGVDINIIIKDSSGFHHDESISIVTVAVFIFWVITIGGPARGGCHLRLL